MNITLTLLGRAAIDAPYTELSISNVVVTDTVVDCTPTVPPAAVGQELALRILADDNAKAIIGALPALAYGKEYIVFGRAPRQVQFRNGDGVRLCCPGVTAAA